MRYNHLIVAASAAAAFAGLADAAERVIPVIYRDFVGTDTVSPMMPPLTHPDFENVDAFCWNAMNVAPTFCGGLNGPSKPDLGIVATALGADTKPVWVSAGNTTTTAANFAKWYNDDPDYNMTIFDELTLTDNNDGIFVFDSAAFFPLNDRGFGNTTDGPDSFFNCFCAPLGATPQLGNNWHFTMEVHTTFVYNGGEEFDYRGDDDLWVFIDGKLVIDIGGVHNPLPALISLDSVTDLADPPNPLNLVVGQAYAFDLFFAERHRNESNFRIETSIGIGNEPCLGDLTGSGSVGFEDLQMLLQRWGTTDPDANLDGMGTVGFSDLQILLQNWGECPTSK